MPVKDWSTTAASNVAVGGVSIDEECNPGNVDDALRAVMADVAKVIGQTRLGIDPSSIAISAAGSGYVVGDAITLACSGVTFTTSPVATVNAVSSGAITGVTITNPGKAPEASGTSTFTQASTTGSGAGATFTANLIPIASYLASASLATGGGVTNGNLFVGAEQPYPRMGGGENTFLGDKAGGGFAGATNANTAVGHNAGGSGNTDLATTGGTATGSYNTMVGNDAARNITGSAAANTIVGQNAGRMMSGSYNVMVGPATGTGADWVTPFSGNYNILIGYQAAPATLRTGDYNILIGALADTTLDGGASAHDFFGVAGRSGLWMRGYHTDTSPSFAMGASSFCDPSSQGAVAMGFGAAATGGFGAVALGQDVTANASQAHARGNKATARGVYGADVFSSGQFSATGDAQRGNYVLRGTGSSTTAIRLTSDGTTAGSANVINIPSNMAYALEVSVVARSITTPGKSMAWTGWGMLLTRPSGTTGLVAASTPTALTNGTVTGASIAITADDTNKGLNVSFTPPTSNTDTWHVVASVRSVEAG